jgi:hypothetical protein
MRRTIVGELGQLGRAVLRLRLRPAAGPRSQSPAARFELALARLGREALDPDEVDVLRDAADGRLAHAPDARERLDRALWLLLQAAAAGWISSEDAHDLRADLLAIEPGARPSPPYATRTEPGSTGRS